MDQDRNGWTIVLADDHELIRHGIRYLIERDEDLTIVGEVGDGEELLAFLDKTVPDLLILDISMPRANGIDLTERLKQRFPDMKILILTIHKTKQCFYRSIAAGADGYLMKNDSAKDLLSAICKIRQGRTYVSPQFADDCAEELLDVCRRKRGNPFRDLTRREKQILGLVVAGHTSRSMAEALNLSPRTIDHHRSNLLKKFNMKNGIDLVHFAVRNGYVVMD